MKTLLSSIALVLTVTVACSQETLGELVDQEGLSWMVGTWQTEVKGKKLIWKYEWDLERNMIRLSANLDGEGSTKGIIYQCRQTGEVRYNGVGIGGGGWRTETGTWTLDDGSPVQETHAFYSPTDERVFYSKWRKVDQNTVVLELYGTGTRQDDPYSVAPRSSMELKRVK